MLLAFASAGCAGLPPQDIGPEPLDRFERVNRGIYRFNRGFDRAVARPVARAYDRVVPPVVERRFRNFFTNLRAPTDITNNWLQGKFKPGFADLGRLLLNTVAGGGLFDPAAKLGLERHPEDFGHTLAAWGVPLGRLLRHAVLRSGSVRDWERLAASTCELDLLWQVDDTSERNDAPHGASSPTAPRCCRPSVRSKSRSTSTRSCAKRGSSGAATSSSTRRRPKTKTISSSIPSPDAERKSERLVANRAETFEYNPRAS